MVPFAALLAALEGIPDPRRRQGRRYPLAPLLLVAVLAVLAGATSYRGILTFIGVHRERLNATFGSRLPRGPARETPPDPLPARPGREHAPRPLPGARAGRAGGRLPRACPGVGRRGAGLGPRAARGRARRQDAQAQLRPPERPGRGARAGRVRLRRRPAPGAPGGPRRAGRGP